jgi:hypothetical protein
MCVCVYVWHEAGKGGEGRGVGPVLGGSEGSVGSQAAVRQPAAQRHSLVQVSCGRPSRRTLVTPPMDDM